MAHGIDGFAFIQQFRAKTGCTQGCPRRPPAQASTCSSSTTRSPSWRRPCRMSLRWEPCALSRLPTLCAQVSIANTIDTGGLLHPSRMILGHRCMELKFIQSLCFRLGPKVGFAPARRRGRCTCSRRGRTAAARGGRATRAAATAATAWDCGQQVGHRRPAEGGTAIVSLVDGHVGWNSVERPHGGDRVSGLRAVQRRKNAIGPAPILCVWSRAVATA